MPGGGLPPWKGGPGSGMLPPALHHQGQVNAVPKQADSSDHWHPKPRANLLPDQEEV